MTANGSQLCMDYHDGKYGVNTDPQRGADTFIPFRSDLYEFESLAQAAFNQKNSVDYTFTEDYSYALVVCASCSGAQTMAVVDISTTAPDYKYLCKDIYAGDVYSRSIRLSLMLIKNVKVGDNIKTSGSSYYPLSQIFGLK